MTNEQNHTWQTGDQVDVYPIEEPGLTGWLVARKGSLDLAWWVPEIANPEAPQLSELNAGMPISEAIRTGKLGQRTDYASFGDLEPPPPRDPDATHLKFRRVRP